MSLVSAGDMLLSYEQLVEQYGPEAAARLRGSGKSHRRPRHLSHSPSNLWRVYRSNETFLVPWAFSEVNEFGDTNALTTGNQALIQDVMGSVEQRIKYIKFVPYDKSQHDFFLHVGKFGAGCYSYVGRVNDPGVGQTVNYGDNCYSRGTIAHELLHALGLYHEHTRSDRDSYVTVKYENIIPEYAINFLKRINNDNGIRYDYGSVMHYGTHAFTTNGESTIDAPEPIGQRIGLSDSDILHVQLLYRCPTYSHHPLDTHCTPECPCPAHFDAPCTNSSQCEGVHECTQGYCGGTPGGTPGGTQPPPPPPTHSPTKGPTHELFDLAMSLAPTAENLDVFIPVVLILIIVFTWLVRKCLLCAFRRPDDLATY